MENETNPGETNSEIIAARLNVLLANYSLFYQNARGFRWHIRGRRYKDLHDKFDVLYSNLQKKIDAIAERIIALGQKPENIFSEYINLSLIPESKKIWEEEEAITNIIESYSTLITMQKEIIDKAVELKDNDTAALMTDFIERQEQHIQMYSSFIEE